MCEHRSGLSFVHVFPLKFRGGNCRGLGYLFCAILFYFFRHNLSFFVCVHARNTLTKARNHITKHKTHNNQHDPPLPYPSATLALSLHGNIHHGPKSWSRCSLWAHTRLLASVRSRHCWVLVWGAKTQPLEKQREGWGLGLKVAAV